MIVKSILSEKGSGVVIIEPTATLADATRVLAEKGIGALVVTGAGERVIGIISERDIVRTLAQQGAKALQLPLTEAMTRKVVTCTAEESVSTIMERMTTGKFRHVPVVEAERLVGIISIGDVVKLRVAEMELEQSALRDYIQTA